MKKFEHALLRLKEQVKLQTDKEVGELLGLGEKAFNARKRRDSFPEKDLRALAQQRPELGIDVLYVLTGEREQIHPETQDQFIDRMQAIRLAGRMVDALPLPEREREGVKLCLTGDPAQDAKAIAEALRREGVSGSSEAPPLEYGRAKIIPMTLNEHAPLTQQEVLALVLDALHAARKTLPSAKIMAVVDAVMAWQRAGVGVTKSSVVEQLRMAQ